MFAPISVIILWRVGRVDFEELGKVISKRAVTESNTENRGCGCVAAVECLLNVVRALQMGSCLSSESRSPLQSPTSAVGRKRKNSKKRPGSRNSSFDYRKEEQLHRIPGRRFLSGSNDVAALFTQQGKKGTNQDAMIVWEVQSLHSLLMF
nr:probable protein phosphatase 2C 33 [Ipomoea batatas]GME19144.1 probable protein phosphatase 2C 33 [Ipomoea batatas]